MPVYGYVCVYFVDRSNYYDDDDSSSSVLSSGAIIGSVLVIVCITVIIILLVTCICRVFVRYSYIRRNLAYIITQQ